MNTLSTPINKLMRVGKVTAKRLEYLGIFTVENLLNHFPFRYEEYTRVEHISDIRSGGFFTAAGTVSSIENRRSKNRRMIITEALLTDDLGKISIIWFNQPFITKQLKEGDRIMVSGKVEFNYGTLQFNSPVFERLYETTHFTTGSYVIPIYSTTGNVTQKQMRHLYSQCRTVIEELEEWMPPSVLNKYSLTDLAKAYRDIHFPQSFEDMRQAQRRIKFNELFLLQLRNQAVKEKRKGVQAPIIDFKEKDIKKFVRDIPFELTGDQKKAAWAIALDMQKDVPMNRLLEGDVGSGKTIVAALAMYNTALNGLQSVLMAPTEILAKQHYTGIFELLKGSDIAVGLLTNTYAQLNGKDVSKDELLLKIAEGKVKIIIGTHALIQDAVSYDHIGLVIVDEQHRFGVDQRKTLKEKTSSKKQPHFLSMTATPIPRSLALIMYGELDVSLIQEMPKGRKSIITKLVDEPERKDSYSFIRKQIEEGRQVFVVCPLIDPSDALGVASVTDEFKKLDKSVFPDLEIGLLHGKLKGDEKEKIMRRFKNNEIKILVSTSVVEVGVDVPNATVMMIEGADRFGLAQLHQFRGRVGRDTHQSYCFMFTGSDSEVTRKRLQALVKSNDGFTLAEYDLQFRGPGEVYGTRQSGIPNLQLATLGDVELIKETKEAAEQLLQNHSLDEFPKLLEKLNQSPEMDHLE